MTVDYRTGEITDTLDAPAAKRLTERIRLSLGSMLDLRDKVLGLIHEARTGRADEVLGFRSWTDYVSSEFADALPRLTADERREFVTALADTGMSTRAIAPIIGVSHMTAARDLAAGVTDVTPQTPAPRSEGEAETGAGQTPEDEVADGSVVTAVSERDAAPPRPPVTGIDGKTYPRPAPRAPKPVLDGEAAEYDNAEQASKSLARAIAKLLEFEHPNMRAGMRRYWDMASIEVPPAQRADVTSEQMRAAAHGLLTLADEWNR